MKKTMTLFLFLFALSLQVFAQDRTVTGRVTSSQDKLGIPGVSVVEPGTTNGAVTDIDGKYSVTVKPTTTQLKFSGTGLVTRTVDIPASNSLDITMDQDVQKLGEVVVTALGIKREQKSLGYATQQIKGKEVSTAKEANFINSLQGKVAGVSITGSSNMGGSSRILLRGVRSINFENQPLFIVDGVPVNNSNFSTRDQVRGALGYDYGNAAQDINPDDIENINILKGSAASALYGSQGANGVVIITTKKGIPRTISVDNAPLRNPIGVSLTTGISFSKVAVLPDYQNKYGGGAAPEFIASTEFPEYAADSSLIPNRANFEYDGSWGPEMNGQEVYQWNSYYKSLATYGKKLPWSPSPDNVKDFFETGVTTNNNVAIEGGTDRTLYRLSYTNYNLKGTVPNSTLNRNIISLNASHDITDKLKSSISLNYVAARGKGRAQTGYSNLASNFTQWWQRQININDLKDYKNPDGTQRTWNMNSETDLSPLYWDNPYWTAYENYQTDQRNRVYGGTTLSYEIFKGITVSGSARTDYYNDNRQERIAVGSASTSLYSEQYITFNENNYELMLNGKKSLSDDFDLSFTLGTNRQDRKSSNRYIATQGGLNVPNLYTLANSKSELLYNPDSKLEKIRRNSVFASASLGYKKFLYLDVTGRNDWSSTLPTENSSYFYPSVTGSFVFSELVKVDWLSFGKIRAGWSQTAIDPQPYSYGPNRPVVTPNFVAQPSAVISGTSNNPDLKPETTTGFEVGTQLDFFSKRVSLDFTYSSTLSKDVIFPVQQSAATGYNFTNYNAAEISNKGFEVVLSVVPVKMASGFEWGVSANYAKNENIVEKLYTDPNGKETESLLIETAPFSVTFQARPGMAYGQIVGYDYVYDANGNKIVDPSSGAYVRTNTVQPLGSILPDFTGGFSTYVQYKGIRLSGTIDFQKGGKLFSLTNTWGKYSGTLAETAEGTIREDGLIVDGVLQTGEDADGNPISDGTVNDVTIAAVDHFFLNGGYIISAADVYDASFVKFRELTLTYDFPDKWFKKVINGASFSVIARNLAILSKNVPNIDPESAVSSNNIQGLEGGQLPTERTIGFSLNVRF